MTTLIGYDITNATAQPVNYDSDLNYVSCEAYDWGHDIGEGEKFTTVQEFIEYATNDGWFKAA